MTGGANERGDQPTLTMPGRGTKRTHAGGSPRESHGGGARPNDGHVTPRPNQNARTRQLVGLTAFADASEYTVMKAEAQKAGPTHTWVTPAVKAYAEALDHADWPKETSHMRDFK